MTLNEIFKNTTYDDMVVRITGQISMLNQGEWESKNI